MLKSFTGAGTYFKKTFGCKVYKLALDGGMTCPNRDGNIGTGGCIFCSEGGSGEFAEKQCNNIETQIERAKLRVNDKIKSGKYIAYFQNYTNTYADVDYLRSIFTQAIMPDDVVAISIATRPDCLPQATVELLCELNGIKPVFVELGLQTANDRTADTIGRGYKLSVFDSALNSMERIGVNTIVHLILGLPGENREMMVETSRYVSNSCANGIKLQLLQVLSGTKLARMYDSGEYIPLAENDYINTLADCLDVISTEKIIHRITGDPPKKLLIAPEWAANKKQVLNDIKRGLLKRNIVIE